MSRAPRHAPPPRAAGWAAGLALALLMFGLGVVAFLAAALRVPRGAVSYADSRPILVGEAVWTVSADLQLPVGASVVEGQWANRAEPGAPDNGRAWCQTAGGRTGLPPLDLPLVGGRSQLLALSAFSVGDVRVELPFKLVDGAIARSAGLAFRLRDGDNYYVARASGLAADVSLYRVASGQRVLLGTAAAPLASGVWHTLTVDARGTRLRWGLDGLPLGEASDSTFAAGGLGLWTEADAVSCFAGPQARALSDLTPCPLPFEGRGSRCARGDAPIIPSRPCEGRGVSASWRHSSRQVQAASKSARLPGHSSQRASLPSRKVTRWAVR